MKQVVAKLDFHSWIMHSETEAYAISDFAATLRDIEIK